MATWEYHCIYADQASGYLSKLMEDLTFYGTYGWELVAVIQDADRNIQCFLKRQKP